MGFAGLSMLAPSIASCRVFLVLRRTFSLDHKVSIIDCQHGSFVCGHLALSPQGEAGNTRSVKPATHRPGAALDGFERQVVLTKCLI